MQDDLADIRHFWNNCSEEEQRSLLTLNMEDVRARARQLDAQAGQSTHPKIRTINATST